MSDEKENNKEPEKKSNDENVEEKPNIDIKSPDFDVQKYTYKPKTTNCLDKNKKQKDDE
jgi:hypothetical protein